ncbi:VOC family protein [Phormidium sp. FACHB-592]|nr:VOC family protein [Phormidium sp. FACHB-592]MBD2075990.1 VOC family protein [Phormidium sp. FACHB-592]
MESLSTNIDLNLVVLRSVDLERALRFYAALGIALSREQHGSGPEHLAATIGTLVLEIYPQGSANKTLGVRLGFRVKSLVTTIARLQAINGVIVSPMQESQWGLRAVVSDPDGHQLELVEGNR